MSKTLPKGASTAVYVNKEGVKYAYYHKTPTGVTAWQHPYTDEARAECPVCLERKAK